MEYAHFHLIRYPLLVGQAMQHYYMHRRLSSAAPIRRLSCLEETLSVSPKIVRLPEVGWSSPRIIPIMVKAVRDLSTNAHLIELEPGLRSVSRTNFF